MACRGSASPKCARFLDAFERAGVDFRRRFVAEGGGTPARGVKRGATTIMDDDPDTETGSEHGADSPAGTTVRVPLKQRYKARRGGGHAAAWGRKRPRLHATRRLPSPTAEEMLRNAMLPPPDRPTTPRTRSQSLAAVQAAQAHANYHRSATPPTAIIIPWSSRVYRAQLLRPLASSINDPAFHVFFVEDAEEGRQEFNRGQLRNMGFLLAASAGFRHIIFSEPYLIPDRTLAHVYASLPNAVCHLGRATTTRHPLHGTQAQVPIVDADRAAFRKYVRDVTCAVDEATVDNAKHRLNGVVAAPAHLVWMMNGYPNRFWGGADTGTMGLRLRLAHNRMKLTEPTIGELQNTAESFVRVPPGGRVNMEGGHAPDRIARHAEIIKNHEATWRTDGLNELLAHHVNAVKSRLRVARNATLFQVCLPVKQVWRPQGWAEHAGVKTAESAGAEVQAVAPPDEEEDVAKAGVQVVAQNTACTTTT